LSDDACYIADSTDSFSKQTTPQPEALPREPKLKKDGVLGLGNQKPSKQEQQKKSTEGKVSKA